MNAEKVLIDDLETEADDFLEGSAYINVRYKGKPFTGIAYEDSQYFHSEYSYVNGFGHGRCFSVYPNGQLAEEFFLDNGEKTEETEWYKSGIKRYYFRRKPELTQRWNEEGALLFEKTGGITKFFYHSGRLKSLQEKHNERTHFGEDGEWAATVEADLIFDGHVHNIKNMIFNGPYIRRAYMDLLQDDDFYMYFIRWLDTVDKGIREEAICSMIKSNGLWNKHNGINLAMKYKVYDAVPYIKLELDNDKKPPTILRIDGSGSYGTIATIAERAEAALESLRIL
jgi:hypothetical protein